MSTTIKFYTLSLHDALPIYYNCCVCADNKTFIHTAFFKTEEDEKILLNLPAFKNFQEQLKASGPEAPPKQDRKSTRLNSSHVRISYAVFCLKKKRRECTYTG